MFTSLPQSVENRKFENAKVAFQFIISIRLKDYWVFWLCVISLQVEEAQAVEAVICIQCLSLG